MPIPWSKHVRSGSSEKVTHSMKCMYIEYQILYI